MKNPLLLSENRFLPIPCYFNFTSKFIINRNKSGRMQLFRCVSIHQASRRPLIEQGLCPALSLNRVCFALWRNRRHNGMRCLIPVWGNCLYLWLFRPNIAESWLYCCSIILPFLSILSAPSASAFVWYRSSYVHPTESWWEVTAVFILKEKSSITKNRTYKQKRFRLIKGLFTVKLPKRIFSLLFVVKISVWMVSQFRHQ